MKKILFITTGGTIGSSVRDGIISVSGQSCRALELYCKKYGNADIFRTVNYMDVLSENMDVQLWEEIVDRIRKTDLKEYGGIIITHGSDTLSYTSAMMGYCLCDLGLPVVLTAADLVPDDPASNAVDNIRGAVAVIRSMKTGVFTVYRNPGDECCSVYLATRVTEADRVRGCFGSFDGKAFAYVRDDELIFSGTVDPETIGRRTYEPLFGDRLSLGNAVLMLRPYPGIDYSCINLNDRIKAVLLVTYHSSSACTLGRGSALKLLAMCREHGTELYLASFPKNALLYETSHELLENGAVPLRHMSDEAAYAKLLLAVNLPEKNIRSIMENDIFFEMI